MDSAMSSGLVDAASGSAGSTNFIVTGAVNPSRGGEGDQSRRESTVRHQWHLSRCGISSMIMPHLRTAPAPGLGFRSHDVLFDGARSRRLGADVSGQR